MTKEELKQEAEEYAEGMAKYYASTHEDYIPSQFEKYLRNAYISSAEPREKRIAELKKEIEELKKTYRKQRNKRIDDLQKENAELRTRLEALEGQTPWKDIKDRSELIGKLTNAKEIISEYVRLANLEKEDTIAIWQLYHKAEQFIKDCEVEK